MRIDELIIDGFKSYATRTVISGWDSAFNCITGLNGSGKSNILDAICFVLGITTMSTVRAHSLQDLIYKRGQAGVTKASVTIVFDNSDKTHSPIGFEDQRNISVTRQIVMGGTSKYLINGHRAQQQTVQQLFQSVQLNINNPNFLIMQGRITKVLNMKPNEILSLIEEAAGTRMFEDRREKAIKTMAKKEKKVDEINGLLSEEVEPKLDKLRTEKRQFVEYQQVQTELERATKLVVSHDYVSITDKLDRQQKDLDSQTAHLQALEKLISKSKSEIEMLNQQVEEAKAKSLEQHRKKNSGGSLQELEQQSKELSQEKIRLKTLREFKSSSLKTANHNQSKYQSTALELEKQIESHAGNLKKYEQEYQTAKEEHAKLAKEKEKKEELLQSLQTGVASKEGQESGFNNEIQQVRSSISEAKTAKASTLSRLNSLQQEIKRDQEKIAGVQQQMKKDKAAFEQLQKELAGLTHNLEKSGFVPERLNELNAREQQLSAQLRELTRTIEAKKRRFAKIDFNYTHPPDPKFDPKSVKGVIAQLFTLDEKHYDAATALEVCAGGRLYQVVVDTAAVASQILKHGQLRQRVTIIPLNKVSAPQFQRVAQKLGAAKQVAPGKVDLALDLIGYEKEVEKAMQYVFGGTLVCSDSESARAVAFNPNIKVTTVTLDGDVYDPNGTLSGGSSRKRGGGDEDTLIVSLQKVHELARRQKELQKELEHVQRAIQKENKIASECRALKKAYDLKQHEVVLAEKKLDSGTGVQFLKRFEEKKAQIEELGLEIGKMEKIISEGAQEIEKIEREMKEFGSNKSGKLKELRSLVDKLQRQTAEKMVQVGEKQDRFQKVQIEHEQWSSELESVSEEKEKNATVLKDLKTELAEIEAKYKQVDKDLTEALSHLESERSRLAGLDEELSQLDRTLTTKSKFLSENNLRSQKVRHEVEKLTAEVEELETRLDHLQDNHTWIATEAQYFGKPGTAYNFYEVGSLQALREQLGRLEQRAEGLKRTVNTRVINTLESMEKKETTLKNMIRTIERDKRKIEETIVQLDDYKRKALETTWEKVTLDFGKVFGELLPGSSCKLIALEGKEITEGLEIKVSLGGVWKDSLAELSGGQRSLVALALILALLQFKPAPMYILDEVDAALDLNHTQNIGHLIKTRFKGSQFIVVSLKEGMFTNANRVFRTRFTEGTSTVTVG